MGCRWRLRLPVVIAILAAVSILPSAGAVPQSATARRPRTVLFVPGEVYPGPGPTSERRSPRLRGPVAALPEAPALVLEGAPPERPAPRAGDPGSVAAPLQIGVHRGVSASQAVRVAPDRLRWLVADGGAAASLVVTSPGAAAVRVAMEISALPAGAEVRFVDATGAGPVVGPLPAEFLVPGIAAAAPAGEGIDSGPDRLDPGEPLWSPVVHGDSLAMEIWIPDIAGAVDVRYRVVHVAHLFASPFAADPAVREAPCKLHPACRDRTSPLVNAIAWQVFEQDGRSFGCTGQLLADTDPDTFKPYYATAAHCISTREAARTGTFLWFHQRRDCEGLHPTETVQTVGGGRLLASTGNPWYQRRSPDFTLLRLRRPPPVGVVFGGWTNLPAEELPGTRIDSLSHPRGTTKRLSSGLVDLRVQLRYVTPGHLTTLFEPPYTHFRVHHDLGSIDGGSSGGGIWIGRRWPEQYLVGVWTSGSSSCPGPDSHGFAGAMDRAFRHVRRWLAPRRR